MDLESLRQKVEERVQEQIIPALLDRSTVLHKKRDWRSCECSYCALKRKWVHHINFAPFGYGYERRQEWRAQQIDECRRALQLELEKVTT